MKAFHLPDSVRIANLLQSKVDLPVGWLERAVLKVEEEAGVRLKRARVMSFLIVGLDSDLFLLTDYPIMEVEFDRSSGWVDIDRERGIVTTDLPWGNYSISYTVGFNDGEIPAVLQVAVERAVLCEIRDEEEDREEYKAAIDVWISQRKKGEEERNAIKANRTKVRQRLPWPK